MRNAKHAFSDEICLLDICYKQLTIGRDTESIARRDAARNTSLCVWLVRIGADAAGSASRLHCDPEKLAGVCSAGIKSLDL